MPYTIVSYFPRKITEKIETYNPGVYEIPEGPSVFHVPQGAFYVRYLGEGQSAQIPVKDEELANEIVRSFVSTLEEVNDTRQPALAVVPGYKTIQEVEKHHFDLVAKIKGKQTLWFARLVQQGDDSWQLKRQHKLITDMQKLAAKALGLKREWAEIRKAEDMQSCPACGEMLSTAVAICRHCGCIVNEQLATEKKLKFAKVG